MNMYDELIPKQDINNKSTHRECKILNVCDLGVTSIGVASQALTLSLSD